MQGPLTQVLEHAPRGPHDQMGAMLKRTYLGPDGDTTAKAQHLRIG